MSLPINAVIPELLAHLAAADQCVLEAPPGAGKTTGVPLALLDQPWLGAQKILMLEPRRLAARAAAIRMAELLNEPVGQTVGYRVRLESRVSKQTRIEVVTEGVLNRLLQDDPSLDGVGLVIFDEFHERSLDADLGLALTLAGRELYGDLRAQPLKLLVMSATLDGAGVADLLGNAPVVRSEGRSFPVTLCYGAPWKFDQRLDERIEQTVLQALADQPGSLLVFLPGQAEIRRAAGRLSAALGNDASLMITPLYGNLSFAEQKQAIEPAPPGKRKIVLATNIAETSLTIDGIAAVVDSGLCREPQFDPATGMTRLATRRISRASSVQRAGRAGRLGPGRCYRLWSESQQDELAAYSRPEIVLADLSGLALQLLNWGVDSPDELHWLTPPPAGSWAQALELLTVLGAIERHQTQWRITAHGKRMATVGAHPRLAHLLVTAQSVGLLKAAADLAALLSDKDPLGQASSVDIQLRLDWMSGPESARLKPLAQQFYRPLSHSAATVATRLAAEDVAGFLLACAYPDRIAQGRGNTQDGKQQAYLLANGRRVALGLHDRLARENWLVIADAGAREGATVDTVYLAARLNPALFDGPLADMVQARSHMQWDEKAGRFIAESRRQVGSLILSAKPLAKPDAQQKQHALLTLVAERGLALFDVTEACEQWRGRVRLVREHLGDAWPAVDDDALLATTHLWLAPYLQEVSTLSHFKKLDLLALWQNLLTWEQAQQLNRLAPERLDVPSGNSAAIDYTVSPPVLAVKLQEMFGCVATPTLVNNQVPVLIHLLSPARKPLQITQDLAGFWAGSYQAVKKDMKGRYPKHPWPDDPLQAMPTAKTKRALNRQA